IATIDGWCNANSWDNVCVGYVQSICGLSTCLAPTTTKSSSKTSTTTKTTSTTAKTTSTTTKSTVTSSSKTTASPSTTACVTPSVHAEWRELTQTEQKGYLTAINCLRGKPSILKKGGATTRWEDYVWVHYQAINSVHYTPQFLPWHRGFLAIFTNDLVQMCGYTGKIPYWDWSADAQKVKSSPIWNATVGFGGDGCFSTPYWTKFTSNVPSNHQVCRSWKSAAQTGFGDLYGNLYTPAEMAAVLANSDFDSFRQSLEGNPHGLVHDGTGGDMAIVSNSPNDPIFWLHHRNVDRFWWKWQQQDPARLSAYSTSASATDSMNYFGLAPSVPVSQALSSTGGGLGGLVCFSYTNSISPNVATTQLFARSPAKGGKKHKYRKLSASSVVSDDYFTLNHVSANHQKRMKKQSKDLEAFVEHINSYDHLLPGSPDWIELGETYGWKAKDAQEEAEHDALYQSL
ncbi:hypothetical protein HDU91_002579, partial [Kappamyces sp. JEL0680]